MRCAAARARRRQDARRRATSIAELLGEHAREVAWADARRRRSRSCARRIAAGSRSTSSCSTASRRRRRRSCASSPRPVAARVVLVLATGADGIALAARCGADRCRRAAVHRAPSSRSASAAARRRARERDAEQAPAAQERRHHRLGRVDQGAVRPHRDGRGDRRHRRDLRRERHRQGAGRAHDPQLVAAPRRAVRRRQLRGDSRDSCSRTSCSATCAARSPTRRAIAKACSPRRTPARCSSTRSASCRCRCRPSSCASCSRRSSAASATITDRRVDVRIITATNRDLDQLVARGSFRQDLYYRINVFPMHLPPLRERPDDIALLVHHFVQKYRARLGKPIDGVTPAALARLAAYDFPGNVRELENKIHQAMVVAAGAADRRGRHRAAARGDVDRRARVDVARPFRELKQETIDAFERAYLTELLRAHRGNLAQAARAAGHGSQEPVGARRAARPRSRAVQEALTPCLAAPVHDRLRGPRARRVSRDPRRQGEGRSLDRHPRAAAVAPARVLEDAARARRWPAPASSTCDLRAAGNPYRKQKHVLSRAQLLVKYRAHLAKAAGVVDEVAEAARGHRAALLCYEAEASDVPSLGARAAGRGKLRCGVTDLCEACRRARRADRDRRRSADDLGRDSAGVDQLRERALERDHAGVAARLDRGRQRVQVALADDVRDRAASPARARSRRRGRRRVAATGTA